MRFGRTYSGGRSGQHHGFEEKNINYYGPNLHTSPTLGVGEGVLCCIATALRGLGHQCRREMVRSDKFANSTTTS